MKTNVKLSFFKSKPHKVEFTQFSTQRVLKTFYGRPLNKFFWEKMKREEAAKLADAKSIDVNDIAIIDHGTDWK